MNRQRNVTGLPAAGLRLEFIPMKIGAGVTNKGGYFFVIPAKAGIQDVIDVQTIMTLLVILTILSGVHVPCGRP